MKVEQKQKITPFLWFDSQAEEALSFYTSIFKNSQIKHTSRYGKGMPLPEGTLMSATIEIEGQDFHLLNGGPMYNFTPAVSFLVNCETQDEVDHLWSKLTDGGSEQPCGWLKDKFGLSWQIIPSALGRLMGDKDPKKSQSVMQAMFKMRKIEIKALQEAYDNA
ncbi:MAG: VOC family protein [Leptospirales bacterium]|nr:VOC family protein [Leptospirales bacterium]